MELPYPEVRLDPAVHLIFLLRAGDTILHIQPGTGGYGDPFERDPAMVLEDVLDEKMTDAYVEREYGVAIEPAGTGIDTAKTAALRESRRISRT